MFYPGNNNPSVCIKWSPAYPLGSSRLDVHMALYMFTTKRNHFYIGYGGCNSVLQRSNDDFRKLDRFIRKYDVRNWRIKVGRIFSCVDCCVDIPLLKFMESLLIYTEYGRGYCRANKVNTRSRPRCSCGLTIINEGNYGALQQRYADTCLNTRQTPLGFCRLF